MLNYSLSIFVTILVALVKSEEKWIWSKEHQSGLVQSDTTKITVAKPILSDSRGQSSRRKSDDEAARFFIDDDFRKARYEVQELNDFNNGRPVVIPIRPRPYGQRPVPNRPPIPPPLPPVPERPLLPPADRFDEFHQAVGNEQDPIRRQPPQSVGILTGPVPSWEKPALHKNGDPTNFEHCKCSFSFNCKSPGIQFGSCDQGKTYCCYNELPKNTDGLAPPGVPGPNAYGSSNVDRFDRLPPILAGPGGPSRPPLVDHRDPKPLIPTQPPRGHEYPPYNPSYEDIDEELERPGYNQKPYPIIPQKPVLPPYMGLHNDYRSS